VSAFLAGFRLGAALSVLAQSLVITFSVDRLIRSVGNSEWA